MARILRLQVEKRAKKRDTAEMARIVRLAGKPSTLPVRFGIIQK